MLLRDIKNEKVKLVKAIHGSKLGKKITDEILMPILNQIEEDAQDVMEDAAQWVTEKITDYMQAATPSGRTYKIYHYDPSLPKGQRSTLIAEHTASAPGQLPAQLTGTLIDAIDYRINADGSFRVGLLKSPGEFSAELTEFESAFFKHGKIFVNPDLTVSKQTPVGTYGEYLTKGTPNMAARPFFAPLMEELKPELRARIRKNMRQSLNKATRRISVRKAIVFKIYFE